jgi:NAD(P)H-hydrate epimerase
MLAGHTHEVEIFILEFGHKGTEDFQSNLAKLHLIPGVSIHFIQEESHFPVFKEGQIIIDALFGTGLNRALEGITAKLVSHINASGLQVISIDLPSGLASDHSSKGNPVINACDTLSFQCYKPALLFAENANSFGKVHILDIGLHESFVPGTSLNWIDEEMAASLYRSRPAFAHKGNFGHALLLAGSYGKMGAAVLAARACLVAGSGLLTACIPRSGYETMQAAVPEAMVETAGDQFLEGSIPAPGKYNAIGVGPGLGTENGTGQFLGKIIKEASVPLVLDADALNLLGADTDLLKALPAFSILTPHPKEFERMFGTYENDFARAQATITLSREFNVIIVLKGHHTLITMPGGQQYFNSTGNPGMAKGGSGDVLTGFLTGLLASGYSPESACILGVFLHGLAGDIAAEQGAQETMIASDIIAHLPLAFRRLYPA